MARQSDHLDEARAFARLEAFADVVTSQHSRDLTHALDRVARLEDEVRDLRVRLANAMEQRESYRRVVARLERERQAARLERELHPDLVDARGLDVVDDTGGRV